MNIWELFNKAIKEKMIVGLPLSSEDLELCKEARRIFMECNKSLYNGELPETDIFINPFDSSECAEFTPVCISSIWYNNTGNPAIIIYPLNIYSRGQLIETVLHEMAHEYCWIKGITDLDPNTAKHTRDFAAVCNAHGLCYEDGEDDWMNTRLAKQPVLHVLKGGKAD